MYSLRYSIQSISALYDRNAKFFNFNVLSCFLLLVVILFAIIFEHCKEWEC